MNIPITKTEFKKEDFENIIKPLESGWVVQGPMVKKFEVLWSEFSGAKFSIAVTSCTTALHLSLIAMNINEGDEVIIPSFTWVATANAVEYLKAKPVFCDIKLDTFNIDPNAIEGLVNKNTKVIIPVHLFGLSADLFVIKKISDKYNLKIVEDAACGFASKYKDNHVGTFGDTGCFSFHPRKAITTGEGGMITTNDEYISNLLRSLRDHGATTSDFQRHYGSKPYLLPEFPFLGYNYRLTDIQAAIGITQMNRANEISLKRRKIAEKYFNELDKVEWLIKPVVPDDYVHSFQSFVCLFNSSELNFANVQRINSERNDFMEYLNNLNIATRPGTHSVTNLGYYTNKYNFSPEDFPNSYIAEKCSITLPLYPSMTDEEFKYVISNIKKYRIKGA